MVNNNLKLWSAVCETDPSATKHINQRGGFTAIDAYSQIYAATEQFGPAGEGWGWEIIDQIFPPNDTIIVHIRMWHKAEVGQYGFDVYGQKDLYKKSKDKNAVKIADEDAAKKALTDAITKGLSYLGFNADVFLGKFDDNKYVESLRTKRERTTSADIDKYGGTPEKLNAWLQNEIMAAVNDAAAVDNWKLYRPEINLLKKTSPEEHASLRKWFADFRHKLPGYEA